MVGLHHVGNPNQAEQRINLEQITWVYSITKRQHKEQQINAQIQIFAGSSHFTSLEQLWWKFLCSEMDFIAKKWFFQQLVLLQTHSFPIAGYAVQ